MDDVEDDSKMLLIQIPITKNNVPRFLAIYGQFYKTCKKYMNLRPNNIENHKRFFLNFFDAKCTRQPIGINTMGQIMTGIILSISKNVTLRLIYTIIISNEGERKLLFGF